MSIDEVVKRVDDYLIAYETTLGYDIYKTKLISKINLKVSGELFLSGLEGYKAVSDGELIVDLVVSVINETLEGDVSCEHRYYYVDDAEMETWNNGSYLVEIADLLDRSLKEGKKILVHCRAGMSRSATVVLYYLITKYLDRTTKEEDVLKAIQIVKNIRTCIYPNLGFIKLLLLC